MFSFQIPWPASVFFISILFVCLYLFCPQSGQNPSCFFLPFISNLNSVWKCKFFHLPTNLAFFSFYLFFITALFSLLHVVCIHIYKNVQFLTKNYFHNSILWTASNICFCLFFCLQRIKYLFFDIFDSFLFFWIN